MASFFESMFKSAAPTNNQQQNNQQQNNQNGGKPVDNGVIQNNKPTNNNQPSDVNNLQQQQKPEDPLELFAPMWDQKNTDQNSAPPSFTLDNEVVGKVAAAQQFTAGINDELMQQALGGDTKALMQIMNAVGQNAYRASLQHNSVLVDKFVNMRSEHEQKNLAPRLKQELTANALASNANFKHPVVRQQLNDTANRLQRQFPDASPQEIATMAADYIKQLAAAIAPPSQNQNANGSNNQQQEETDWSQYLAQDGAQ